MQNFPVQISLSWWIFVLAGGFVLLLTGVVTTMNSLKTANSNPIDSLRYE
jgi:ABC-type lipoprotein release transport system permease subunit